jgi:sulfur-oxidizing protein SoxA
MKRRAARRCQALLSLTVIVMSAGFDAIGQSVDGRVAAPLPGRHFQSAETQRLEADADGNPGLLWLEQGRVLWNQPVGTAGKACAECHGAAEGALRGAAARHPRLDAATGRLFNIEAEINRCRTERQGAPPLAYDSDALLGLTLLVTRQSQGVERRVDIEGAARPYFEQGRAFFHTRQGQLNIACSQCHDDNAGRRLRGDRISQGQTEGWPAYRLEWQKVGSLHRRLRACSLGVRAEVLDAGSPEYMALELYLAWRGEPLEINVPGVRR